MNTLYRITYRDSLDVSTAGNRMRSLALRTGFSDARATSIGMLVRELMLVTEEGSTVQIGLRSQPRPSTLTVTIQGLDAPEPPTSGLSTQADTVERSDRELRMGFVLPEPDFLPDSEWLRETQIWLAEQTPAELHRELARTNHELRIVLEQIRRQARNASSKAQELAVANTKLEQMHAKEYRLARFDPVSSLPSRLQFESRLAEQIEQALKDGRAFALLFIDLDYFKNINDNFGHAAGDHALGIVGQRMTATLRDSDTVGRLGGDEFGVLLNQISHPDDAGKVAAMLIAAIRDPIEFNGGSGSLDASIGIAICPDDGTDAETLLKHADEAMYAVKRAGRGDHMFYDELEDSDPTDETASALRAKRRAERKARERYSD